MYFDGIAGAILANGRGGRETTLWTEQKQIFNKKLVIFCLQINKTQWFSGVLYMIQQMKVFEEASRLFVSINWARWSEKRVKAELRPPLRWFLEWPLN